MQVSDLIVDVQKGSSSFTLREGENIKEEDGHNYDLGKRERERKNVQRGILSVIVWVINNSRYH